jgi:methionyl-tRNA formyltransferase
MTKRVDWGDILEQFALPILVGEDEAALQERLFREAARRLDGVLRQFADGGRRAWPQPRGQGSYQGYPTPRQRRELARRLVQSRRRAAASNPRRP